MKLSNAVMLSSAISLGLLLGACDQKKSEPETKTQDTVVEIKQVEKADVLPYLNIQEQPAKIALPFCETKNCIETGYSDIGYGRSMAEPVDGT